MRVVISFIAVFLGLSSYAAIPDFITYSGRITDGSYDGISQEATITFRLFDAEVEGNELWEYTDSVVVQDGYFSVMLSEGTANDQPKTITTVFAEHGETWMELEVGGQVLEREAVGSVPYSAKAGVAENTYCPSVPCDNDDFVAVIESVTIDPDNGTGQVTAYCPPDKPIPVVGSCETNAPWIHIYRAVQTKWTVPASWGPGNMPGWICAGMNINTDGGHYVLYSIITCKREN